MAGAPAEDTSVARAFRAFAWLWAIRWCASIACDGYDSAFPTAHAGPFSHHVTATITAVTSALALAALVASKLSRVRRAVAASVALAFALAAVPALARVSADIVVTPAPRWATSSGDAVPFLVDHVAPIVALVLAFAVHGRAPRRLVRALVALALVPIALAVALAFSLRNLTPSFDAGWSTVFGIVAGASCLLGCALTVLVVTTALVAAGDASLAARRRAGLLAWVAANVYILAATAAGALGAAVSMNESGVPYWFLVALGAALVASAEGGLVLVAAVAGACVCLFLLRFVAFAWWFAMMHGDAYLYATALASSVANVVVAVSLTRAARAAERTVLSRVAVIAVVAATAGLVAMTQTTIGATVSLGALVVHAAVVVVVAYRLQRPEPVAEPPLAELSVGGVED
jgi:hypothetical protein